MDGKDKELEIPRYRIILNWRSMVLIFTDGPLTAARGLVA